MMTLQELAVLVEADPSETIAVLERVSTFEDASENAVVFATDIKALRAALRTRAGAILASMKIDRAGIQADERVLVVHDARYAFALAGSQLQVPLIENGVHATAVIGEGAELGQGSTVGPYAVIGKGVQIGRYCRIAAHVTIYPGTTLGDSVVIQAGAVLGSTGFGYARHADTGDYLLFPQQGTLVVEANVDVGANTTIDRGALGVTRIGEGTKIDNLVHIGHNCLIGKQVVIAAQTGISGSSVIEDGAILGGQVGIGEHATVGKGVILGGGAGVLSGKKMQGSGQVFWGRPARPLKEYLRGMSLFSEAARRRRSNPEA